MRPERRFGLAVNIALRVVIVAFAVEAVLAQTDPRFAGKGIAVRDLILAGAALTLVIPALHAIRGRGKPYPLLADSLLLSAMALDMAGNHFGLYDQAWRFDLVAHGYGPAAVMVALASAGVGWTASMLAVNGGHILLEIQEATTDALFDTHNVRGMWDTTSDLAAGLATTVVIWWIVTRWGLPARLRHGRGAPHARACRRGMKQPAVPPPA
jgi:hypothetical protein